MTDLEIKAAVRERDNRKCVDCGMTGEQHMDEYGKKLHVHRLIPGSSYTIDGCVTTCYRCHRIRHAAMSEAKRGEPLYVRMRQNVHVALKSLAKKNRRLFSEELSIALEKHVGVILTKS